MLQSAQDGPGSCQKGREGLSLRPQRAATLVRRGPGAPPLPWGAPATMAPTELTDSQDGQKRREAGRRLTA